MGACLAKDKLDTAVETNNKQTVGGMDTMVSDIHHAPPPAPPPQTPVFRPVVTQEQISVNGAGDAHNALVMYSMNGRNGYVVEDGKCVWAFGAATAPIGSDRRRPCQYAITRKQPFDTHILGLSVCLVLSP